MLLARAKPTPSLRCRLHSTISGFRPVQILPDGSTETFRRKAYDSSTPYLLPRASLADLPAVKKWFTPASNSHDVQLNARYFSPFGATMVPLEITNDSHFARIEYSLSFFLECVSASTSAYQIPPRNRYFSAHVPGARKVTRTKRSNHFFSASALTPPTARVYLAQASLADFPSALRRDLPTPDLVLKAGKGDVYDASIWLGQAPTYTPLHRDPNPNLFVQLAGKKVVRLLKPRVGDTVFAKVQERIQGSASAVMRGEEMMQGAEKTALEDEIWGEGSKHLEECWEATLITGDGLFIPKGWWHSVKGVGEGMNGSVNWWFR